MDEELKTRFDRALMKFGVDWIKKSMAMEFERMVCIMYDHPEYIDFVVDALSGKEVVIAFEMVSKLQDKLFVRIQ